MIRRCAVSTKTSSPFYAHGFSSAAGMTFHVHDTVRCVYFVNRHCIALSVQPQGGVARWWSFIPASTLHTGVHMCAKSCLRGTALAGVVCQKLVGRALIQAARRLKKLIFLSGTSTPGEPTGAVTALAAADPFVTEGAISSGMHWAVGNQAVVLKPTLLTCPLTTCGRVPVTGVRVISRRCPPPQHT